MPTQIPLRTQALIPPYLLRPPPAIAVSHTANGLSQGGGWVQVYTASPGDPITGPRGHQGQYLVSVQDLSAQPARLRSSW